MNILNAFTASRSAASNFFKLSATALIALTSFTFPAAAEVTLPTTGEQKTLVLLVNFQEDPNEQPLTIAEAHNLVFGEVNDFYRENSFEQTWLSGQVAGWFTVPLSNQVCDPLAFQDAADEKAIDAGIPLADYDRILYLWTKTACIEEGSATMGAGTTRAYANGVFTARLIAHELGHNFGLHHSHALDCGAQPLSDQCTSLEYGDTYDVMGKPDIGYFNTFQKEQLGWLDGEHASKIIEATQDGIYSIANYETQSDQPVTIKVPRGVDSATGAMRWFYIEYRQSVGFDSFLDARSYQLYRGDVTDGIVIRIATEGDGNSSNILHFKTDSEYRAVTGLNDWYDPAMPVGGSYTDPVSGVTLSLISAANGMAEVSVIFGGSGSSGTDTGDTGSGSCTTNVPAVDAVAMTENAVSAGEEVQYLVTVTNTDAADCASTGFDISAEVPSGWQTSSEQVTLVPGESGQAVISVVSSVEAPANDYSFSMLAAHTTQPESSATAAVTYTVVAESNPSPAAVAVDDHVVITTIEPVVIDVLANDNVPELGSVSLASFTQPSKGRLEQLADGTLRYTPEKRFKTSDSFSYTISDGNTTSTALVSVTLEMSSEGESKGNGKGNKK